VSHAFRSFHAAGSNLGIWAALIAVIAGWLGGCATGTAFTRPPEGFARLGETTRTQVEALLGKPDSEETVRRDGLVARMVGYTFSDSSQEAKVPNTLCIRSINFGLVGEIVFAEHFVSACLSDHTDFDERKADRLIKGQTLCDGVPAILGRPSYRAIYPLTKVEGEVEIGYEFQFFRRPLLQFDLYRKELLIRCDAGGLVRDVTFSEAGNR
jgi:hypothetical protein